MDELCLPALDTVPEIGRLRGALTLELSRGCQWNACTFCPRKHKSGPWRTLDNSRIVKQLDQLNIVCEQFGITKHIFLADEEFMGGSTDADATVRMRSLAQTLINQGARFRFDAAARADQVYSPSEDLQWHTDRLEMWHLCRKAGLDRLFMGLESGSDTQLRRYGKGLKAEQSVIAIRLLSALGIPLRFGFIMFDPLMQGFKELRENLEFLERTDGFMHSVPVDGIGYRHLFERLTGDPTYVRDHQMDRPIYAGVSYMAATLEVLIDSRYQTLMLRAESQTGENLIPFPTNPDTNMGRHRVQFIDKTIGIISNYCQKWIDYNFALAYSVKSLYKVAPEDERSHLMSWMIEHRRSSILLLHTVLWILDPDAGRHPVQPELSRLLDTEDIGRNLVALQASARLGVATDNILPPVLEILREQISATNKKLDHLITEGYITDTADERLRTTLRRWFSKGDNWELINDPTRELSV